MEYLIQGTTLTGIADAIRGKTGSAEAIAVSDMANQIAAISVGEAVAEYDGSVREQELLTLTASDGYVITDSNGLKIIMWEE